MDRDVEELKQKAEKKEQESDNAQSMQPVMGIGNPLMLAAAPTGATNMTMQAPHFTGF